MEAVATRLGKSPKPRFAEKVGPDGFCAAGQTRNCGATAVLNAALRRPLLRCAGRNGPAPAPELHVTLSVKLFRQQCDASLRRTPALCPRPFFAWPAKEQMGKCCANVWFALLNTFCDHCSKLRKQFQRQEQLQRQGYKICKYNEATFLPAKPSPGPSSKASWRPGIDDTCSSMLLRSLTTRADTAMEVLAARKFKAKTSGSLTGRIVRLRSA